ncbi:alkaline phosphatase [Stachybotrys elegans]|uniref:Alkaline phosphatase n=1 Tax=Stachybotrys elegans TaxID=80388 RepID=A0A8K0SI33_9HYPO|nr:alkaline phosphatase [Stachybotrys elegans]
MKFSAILAVLPLALAAPQKRAPLHVPRDVDLIEGHYIVKLKAPEGEFRTAVDSVVSSIVADADHVYENFGGFAATLTPEEVEALRSNPAVEFIEQDAEVHTFATQTGAPWGLARLSNTNTGSTTYTYDDTAGAGTCAYIIDTGIQTNHPDFGTRAVWGRNFVGTGTVDDNGHGTHVAGTIGGTTYGVAKRTTLIAVKVLNASGSGTFAGVVAGMDWVASDGRTRAGCSNGVVVNMSLGGGFSASVNTAAAGITSAGLFLAVAAGNENQNAANVSPASAPTACTVGASDSSDRVASFSNWGPGLDIYAPGVSVLSAWPTSSTNTISGTSMASPHIAGLGAYYLGLGASTPANLCSYIASQALSGRLSGVRSGTVNLLAQN